MPHRKIFVLDDNQIDRETCRRHLGRSAHSEYEVIEHNSVEGALDIVKRENPDCILLDYHLHDGNGLEFLEQLRDLGKPMLHPVVMLTGTGSEAIAVAAMKGGAQDYLVKDRLNPEILHRAVEGAIYKVSTERLIDRQRNEMEQLFREAQEANARKDHFLATLSHELRTPLTPVLVAVSAMDSGTMDAEETSQMLRVIRRNIELEARLIDDLLDLTRISTGKLEVETRPADLHNVLQHAVETCEDDIVQKDLKIAWNLNATSSVVAADSPRLQQIFWNVLKNAVKFTPKYGRIDIQTQNPTPETIELTIGDNGIGIHPDNLEKIFNAFEQGDSNVTQRFGGLGLGLAISKALVEAHGGTIRAESDSQMPGARFIVTLPTAGVDADTSPPAPPPDHSANHPVAPRTILLVEDHSDSAKLLSHFMRKTGYTVHVAPNLAQAITLFESETIDCVVSDIGLPDGTGTELIARLNKIKKIPAIALSGYGMERDIENSRQAGFNFHLTKPIGWQKLKKALETVLSEAPAE